MRRNLATNRNSWKNWCVKAFIIHQCPNGIPVHHWIDSETQLSNEFQNFHSLFWWKDVKWVWHIRIECIKMIQNHFNDDWFALKYIFLFYIFIIVMNRETYHTWQVIRWNIRLRNVDPLYLLWTIFPSSGLLALDSLLCKLKPIGNNVSIETTLSQVLNK